MEITAFAVESEIEEGHWWFVGRRNLFSSILDDLHVRRDASILDLGTSTGTNLRMLRDLDYVNVVGLDYSPQAIAYCQSKGLGPLIRGDACKLPFPENAFDFVLATDIIEHIEDDNRALAEINRVLRPGGQALITVPAFQSLWGLQDDKAFHVRRYRRRPLLERIARAGLTVKDSYHFNYLLFVPIWGARQIIRLLKLQFDSENQVNSPLINSVLKAVFAADIRSAPRIRPPFGVSILALGQKSGQLRGAASL